MKKNQTLMKSISTNRMGAPSIRILSNGYPCARYSRKGVESVVVIRLSTQIIHDYLDYELMFA